MPKFDTLAGARNPVASSSAPNFDPEAAAAGPTTSVPAPYSQPSGTVTLPMIMATVMVFMQLGRPFDDFLHGYHLPAVIGSIGIVVMLFTQWLPTLKTKVGIFLVLFVAIMCVACFFSIWRGGSAAFVQQYIELNIAVFCLLGAAPATVGHVRWLALVALFSYGFNVAVGSGFDAEGRLFLTNATFGNSDEVALLGGLSIPLVLLLAGRLGKLFGALAAVCGIVGCLALVELSGARFGLISLTIMALVYFARAGGAQRVGLFIGFSVLAIGSVLLLPKSTVTRLAAISAIWNDEPQGGVISSEAITSMQDRKQLSKDALQAFVTHPLLGVGPDVFIDWRWDALHRRGQPPHNSYLQAAAEDGIFGLIFYTAFLIAAFLTLQRCLKRFDGWEDGRQVALALQQCLIYFMVSELFINCLPYAHQFVLAGLAVALDRLRRQYQLSAAATGNTPIQIKPEPRPNRILTPPQGRPRPVSPAADAPRRPPRYRFNRPIATSRND